jgi:hypothetical protein
MGNTLRELDVVLTLLLDRRFNCTATTEAIGIGGLRERSLSSSYKVNAGAKLLECTSASQ